VRVLLESNVKRIEESHVEIEVRGTVERLANDAVIVNAGGVLPTPFLQKLGIEVETKYGTR
jgi:NADH dehydrogenase FAD-containing subunit